MALTHDITHALNDVIQACLDGESGFAAAANALDDPGLKNELIGYSTQRRRFANELQSRIASGNEDPAERGTAAGALHRGWMNLRTAISTNDRYSILAECERGEDAAVETYRRAIESDLPPEYDSVVQMQFDDVLHAHDRIRALRDMAKGASDD